MTVRKCLVGSGEFPGEALGCINLCHGQGAAGRFALLRDGDSRSGGGMVQGELRPIVAGRTAIKIMGRIRKGTKSITANHSQSQ